MLKQDAEPYSVFTLEWADYHLVNSKVAVVCFAFLWRVVVKFRAACPALNRGNISHVLTSLNVSPRLDNGVDLPFP